MNPRSSKVKVLDGNGNDDDNKVVFDVSMVQLWDLPKDNKDNSRMVLGVSIEVKRDSSSVECFIRWVVGRGYITSTFHDHRTHTAALMSSTTVRALE